MSIRMKTWDELSAPQKEHALKLASAAGIPAPNVTTGVYHTRGDFVSGSAWQFMKAWHVRVYDNDDSVHRREPPCSEVIIAAHTVEQAIELIRLSRPGGIHRRNITKPTELFLVAGVVEPCIIKVI